MNSKYFCPNLTFDCEDDYDCEMCNASFYDLVEYDSLRMKDSDIAIKTTGR
jgi:hypothetical protein